LKLALISSAILLSACATSRLQVLSEPDGHCIEAIERFVQQETDRPAHLNSTVFRASSELLLEPSNELKMSGRVLGKPEVFVLRRKAGQCVIEYSAKPSTQALPQCQCKTP
jgi:hypothetical protein